jgi:hypothetical protein
MGIDASPLLGTTQIAGTKVNPRGTTAAIAGRTAAGGVVASEMFRRSSKKQQTDAMGSTPDFGRFGFLAVTADELVLIRMTPPTNKSGTKLDAVLVRASRDQVASVSLRKSAFLASPITITFVSGDHWLVEAPRPCRRTANGVVQAMSKAA